MLAGVNARIDDLQMVIPLTLTYTVIRHHAVSAHFPPSTLTQGAEPNGGPQTAGSAGRGQGGARVVHQGQEDESHLPHTQPVQHRRHPEVSHRRGVVSRL